MISLYVSHKFVEEFQNRTDWTDEIIYDFRNRFLKKIRGIEVITDSDFDGIEDLVNESEFYSDLSEINGIVCDKTWLDKLKDESFLYSGNLSKVFLLGNDFDCKAMTSEYNLLFINNSNLLDSWNDVRTDREISEMTPSNSDDNPFSFHSWEKLKLFKHPFHDLLIFDLYLLGDKSNQKIDDNLIPMLNCLSEFNPKQKFELTILTKEFLKPKNIYNPVEKIEEVFTKIGIEKCKLIYYDAQKSESLKEHDRQLYTNYMVFDCGAGWNIFNQKGGVNTSTKIIGRSIFRNDSKNSSESALQNFKKYFEAVKHSKIQIAMAGQFDDKGKLKFDLMDYHYPLDFYPVILK
ncbi:MAG: hypothetical protein H6605_04675 [Flavobacteriales bacterium]|nr:hypothetical protein [Flavobacteriales bacterium]